MGNGRRKRRTTIYLFSLDDFRIIRDQLFGDKKRDIGDRDPVQYAVFIDPPLAHIGITEEEALKRGYSFKVSRLPATSVVRSRTLQQTDGMLKAIINNHNGKLWDVPYFALTLQKSSIS